MRPHIAPIVLQLPEIPHHGLAGTTFAQRVQAFTVIWFSTTVVIVQYIDIVNDLFWHQWRKCSRSVRRSTMQVEAFLVRCRVSLSDLFYK